MKSTAGGRVGKVRGLARDDVQRLPGAELRDRVQQRSRVGMLGVVEQAAHRLHLHDLAGVHHRNLVAHLGHDPQVVGDEDEGHAGRALQVLQQIQVLELDGHVEIGRGLVGDDDLGAPGLGDGADDALAHPTAHLVREVLHP